MMKLETETYRDIIYNQRLPLLFPALCAQPYVSLRDLEQEAAKVGIGKEQLHRALQFLHATG